MKNNLGREIFDQMKAFASSDAFEQEKRRLINTKTTEGSVVFLKNIEETFKYVGLKNGMTISFHHHLRNGDKVINFVCDAIKKQGFKDITVAASSLFPNNTPLVDLIKDQTITGIVTNYINGPIANAVGMGYLKKPLIMDTHGGRARAIESGDLTIDVAFIATPAVDIKGNGSGKFGPSACGTLGYAIQDLMYAKKVVLISDYMTDNIIEPELSKHYVDAILMVDKIGDSEGIVSGTTKITRDPVGRKIARDTVKVLEALNLIKDGFSMQTGAGGISLAVVEYVKNIMISKNIKARFASGGITGQYVDMLENNLVDTLYDVQCFDLKAARSYRENRCHIAISASKYGNPFEDNPVVNDLDFVILGATEVDLDFNVNVTTDSLGQIMGGSGGHADTAHGAKVTIIVTNLLKARLPIIKEKVTCVTTPGEDIDIVVTERGIAINPLRTDLIETLSKTKLPILTMKELMNIAHDIAGIPSNYEMSKEPIGYVRYRDGSIIDTLYKIK
jgi:citrate lyase subunit alpha/citrate CoA-transferase